MTLHEGPPVFSRHEKLRGGHLEPAVYAGLPEPARDRLAEDLARFYAELHALPHQTMRDAGAGPIWPWLPPDEILRRTQPKLDGPLRNYVERTVIAWSDLPPDPYGITFGFFDGHGWNMAFDAAAQRLMGVYDFGDCGFGLLQQEFIYASMISPDLVSRTVRRYVGMTGREVDRERVALLFEVLRLSELAEAADDDVRWPLALESVRSLSADSGR
jgi:hypothetical protein